MADSLLGRVVWYELLTTDVDGAERFYAKVLGWTVAPFEGAKERYDVWMRAQDESIGGVMPIPAGMNFPPHWGMYIAVPRLEDAVAAIERKGGSTLSPLIEVAQVGRMRTMKDPQGATFSILERAPGSSQRPEKGPQLGDASWHELYTTDSEAAMTFYTEVFGWRAVDSVDMGPMGLYRMFARDPGFGGGMMNKPPEMARVPPSWNFYFLVTDVHAGAERVKANGGSVLNGPAEVPGGDWIVNCQDPQGAAFSLHHKKK